MRTCKNRTTLSLSAKSTDANAQAYQQIDSRASKKQTEIHSDTDICIQAQMCTQTHWQICSSVCLSHLGGGMAAQSFSVRAWAPAFTPLHLEEVLRIQQERRAAGVTGCGSKGTAGRVKGGQSRCETVWSGIQTLLKGRSWIEVSFYTRQYIHSSVKTIKPHLSTLFVTVFPCFYLSVLSLSISLCLPLYFFFCFFAFV